MPRRRTPQEKKALEYAQDHISYPNSRECEKKRRANREYRHRVHKILARVKGWQGDYLEDETQTDKVTPRPVGKAWEVFPLGDVVARRLKLRAERTAWKFFRRKYWAPRDRIRFIAYLTSLVEGKTQHSANLASLFADVLDVRTQRDLLASLQPFDYWESKRKPWLYAFFQDEPEWRERVRGWVESFEE